MNYLHTLSDIPQGTSVCIFGAGDYGISLFRLIQNERSDIKVICFADSFKTGKLCGVDIYPPDQLNSMSLDWIIIASHNYVEHMAEMLNANGINNYFALNPLFNSKYALPEKLEDSDDISILHAFYDFSVSPHGFDFVLFLYLAEIQRVKLGCDMVQPVIAHAPEDMLIQEGKNYENGMSNRIKHVDRNDWWYHNIIVPACWLMPSTNQLINCHSREQLSDIFSHSTCIYPDNYHPNHPVEGYSEQRLFKALRENDNLPSFRASDFGIGFAKQWIDCYAGGRKVISITLRELKVQQHISKNSDVSAWGDFLQSLDLNEYCPVIVRDTTMAMEKIPPELSGCLVYEAGPWNLEVRLAFYQLAYLNMFVGNGPGIFSILNRKIRSLIFMRPQAGNVTAEQKMEIAGADDGAGYPNLSPFQKMVFTKQDSSSLLKNEFEVMVQKIEAAASV